MGAEEPGEFVVDLGALNRQVVGDDVAMLVGDRGECRELEDYMPTVNKMIAKYGYKSVFLATPDPTVLKDVGDYPDVNFQYLPTTNTTTLMKQMHFRKIDDAHHGSATARARTHAHHSPV